MEMLEGIAASAGLGPLGALGPLLVGVVLLLLVVKLLSMPFKLVWNGICGALLLWVVNLLGSFVGFGLKITVIKALIAGFFGVPGAAAVILFEIFGK
ncbi:pro-sigmaK processing inhibitor BofA family protein [uncultured Phascolarctobacterium sp.]|uniref:pro-sigmaK processing inhibitor BofA family protein n=2 Tax=Phascolarctobacterium TaxID=33024 RepID=UPI0025D0F104|nr:pro-sigmaK processing inhibitor BofA family protein [uncultured Phascolarctobacterium sp.]